MRVFYVAHPVRPVEGETIASNLDRARRWIRWLHEKHPERAYIAPWIVEVEIYGDSDEQREASLVRVLETVRRCDGIVLVGGRVSPGMQLEAECARDVWSLMHLGPEPPEERRG